MQYRAMKYWPIATKITTLVANRQEEWRINWKDISSNGSLILSDNISDSAREEFLIFTDRKLTYTELTDGFCNWGRVFTARYSLNNLNQLNYLGELQTFHMQCQYWTVLLVHSRSSHKFYRYAVLCTLCCLLSIRSTHSAILHLLSVFFVLVTQNSLSGLCYKLVYNFVTVTMVFQLNVTHFHLSMPLYQ